MNLTHLQQALEAHTKYIDESEEVRDNRCKKGWVIRWHFADKNDDQYLAIEKDRGFGWGYEDYWYTTVFDSEDDAKNIISILEQHYPHSTFSSVKNDFTEVKSEMNERIYALKDAHKLLCKIVNYFKSKQG